MASSPSDDDVCDYVVVGSGPGGGTVAARLAEAGWHVVLLEAGGDPRELTGGDPLVPGGNRLPDDYDVPGFHPFASRERCPVVALLRPPLPAARAAQARSRLSATTGTGGKSTASLYPRASCLGGCSAHNALIFIAPPDADWDALAAWTGDKSWSATRMARYFARLERCRHRWLAALAATIGIGRTGHGWRGWLQTEKALPREALDDGELVSAMANSALAALGQKRGWWQRFKALLRSFGDPNDRSVLAAGPRACSTRRCPRAAIGGTARASACCEVADRYPDGPRDRLNCLATRVLLDEHTARPASNIAREPTSTGRTGIPSAAGVLRQRAGAPRGHPVRRHLQHAAAADAVGHRAARPNSARLTSSARRLAGSRPQPPGPVRDRRRQSHRRADLAVAARRHLRTWRQAVAQVGALGPGYVQLQRRRALRRRQVPPGQGRPAARPLRDVTAGVLHRILPRLFARGRRAPQPPHMGRAEGAHPQPGRPGHPASKDPSRR